ncbi:MAG: MAPEG family protein [Candidatus Binataceae bacterium]
MNGVVVVTALALLEYSVFATLVGRARAKYGVPAPAITGHPEFERYFRVQQNTLEQLVVFVPALWIFASYVNAPTAVALGLVFVVARAIYAMGYIKEPKRRAPGAMLTFGVNAILVVGALIGGIISAG